MAMKMKKSRSVHTHYRWFLALSCAVLLFILALAALATSAAADPLSPEAAVRAAREAVATNGTYRIAAQVQQHIMPRSVPQNLGRRGSLVTMHLEGEVAAPDQARFQWDVATGRNQDPRRVEVVVAGNEVHIGRDGRWTRVQDELGTPVPVADSLSLLDAIRDVERLPDVDTAAGASSRYRFAIDGPRYAEMMRTRTETVLRQDLSLDVQVSPDPRYWNLAGTGQLWVGADGLPRRLVIDLRLPEVATNHDAQVQMQIDYSDFGAHVASIEPPGVEGDGGSVPSVSAPGEQHGALSSLLAPRIPAIPAIALLAVVAALAVRLITRGRRTVYAAVVGATVLSMIVSYPLQAITMARAYERLAERTSLPQALAELGLASSADETARLPEAAPGSGLLAPAADEVTDCLTLPTGIVAADDYDGDNISNVAEHCFGTSYRDADTDGDTISDSEELEGFTSGGKTWTTDPLQADSNLDGVNDAAEWSPNWVATQPGTLDFDGDGVPNPWDDDNDGDGVLDEDDISPYKVLDYKSSYNVTVTKPTDSLHEDTYVYIDILAQPQDTSHLRYYTTPLDWPHDDKAQIQDLDTSKDDVTLIPVLELKSTTKPSLTSEYGLVVQNGVTVSDPFRVLAPLSPVGDWGATDAFKTRFALTAAESASGIQLTDIRLGWLVQVKKDTQKLACHLTYIGGVFPTWSCSSSIDSNEEIAVAYYESSFRIAGLSVTESEDVDVALFGAPNSPETTSGSTNDEGREMFNLATNFAPRFLYNAQPTLQTITNDFSQSGNAIYTDWHISSTIATDRNTFAHRDLALATTTTTDTEQFLDSNYATTRKPLLVMGYQETAGTLGLEATDSVSISGNSLTFDLSGNTLATVRQVQLTEYQYVAGQWKAMSMNETVSELQTRYASQAGQRFEGTLAQVYLTYYGGMTNYVAVNGASIVGDTPTEQALVDLTDQPTQTTLPGFVNATYQLDLLADLSDAEGDIEAFRSWEDSMLASGAAELQGVIDLTVQLQTRLADSSSFIADGFEWMSRVSASATQAVAGSASNPLSYAASQQQALNTTLWISGIAPIVEAVGMWSQYSNHKGDVSAMQSDMELATAIAATIVAVVVFLLVAPFAAIGSLLAAFTASAIIDTALNALGLDIDLQGVFNDIVKWIVGVISDFSLYSKLKDDNPVTSSAMSMSVANPDDGLVVGNPFSLGITYSTAIVKGPGKSKWNWTHSRGGRVSDVNDSSAYGQWLWNSVTAAVTHDTPTYSPVGCSNATDSNPQRNCTSNTAVTITPQEAVRNLGIALTTVIHYSLRYQRCWGVSFIYDYCEAATTSGVAPSSSDQDARNNATSSVYLDVFPNTVAGLWNWSEINNRDADGDGLLTSRENSLPTSSSNWDSDGDRLSDEYERQNQGTLGTLGWRKDTDHDGLYDRQELLVGTSASVADTDGDGLSDGEEVCHLNAAGNVQGGWSVTTLDNAYTYHVCSNPLEADVDNDTMSDAQEKAAGTSPMQPNTAPQLIENVLSPLTVRHGVTLTVLGPEQTLTEQFTLTSDLATPISETLSWCAPTGEFGDLSVTGSSSNSGFTMPSPTSASVGGDDCTQWDFSQNPLHTGEAVTVTLQVPALSSGTSGPITPTLTLPYTDPVDNQTKQVQQSQGIIIDTDPPTSIIAAPAADDFIDGDSYVVGGSAEDAASWVDQVEVSVDAAAWQLAAGTDSWTWVWTLPADGTYTLYSRATDIVGNVESAPYSTSVTVDNTAPGASFTSLTDGEVITGITPNTQGGAAITIEGSATDLLSGVSLASGVEVVQLSIDGGAWQTVWPTGRFRPEEPVSWSHVWDVNATAGGPHSLGVRAIDALGQVGDATYVDVIIDVLPPLVETDSHAAYLPGNTPSTLLGFVDDNGNVPAPSHPVELSGNVDSQDDATVWLQPDSLWNPSGTWITWIGDFNADGLGDAAIGMPYYGSTGQVALVYGAAGGWPELPDVYPIASLPSSLIASDATQFGGSLAPAGDVNGDGHSDLLIGDQANNRVFVVFGRIDNTGPAWDLSNLGENGQSAYGYVITSSSGTVGRWIASAGDVNDDGYGDLLIGTSSNMYLLMGRSRVTSQTVDIVSAAAAVAPFGSTQGSIAKGVGDVDGDALDDFVITDPGDSYNGGHLIYLFAGSGDYRTPSRLYPQQTLNPRADATATFGGGTNPGWAVAALGDVNGDSLADFMYNSGTTPRLVFGRQGGGWSAGFEGDLTLSYDPAANGHLVAPGDVNADGYDDMILGYSSSGNVYAYVLHGAASLTTPPVPAAVIQNVGLVASTPYAEGADINGDLSSDLLTLPGGIGGPTSSTAYVTDFTPGAYDATVDDDYCETCTNDGLVWQVNAFNTIGDAVAAASTSAAEALSAGQPATYTIGVAAGSYSENVSLPSYTYLEGANADDVTITGTGSGSVVTVDGAKHVQVSGVTVTGAGTTTADAGIKAVNASSYVTITRSIIRDNVNGIIFGSAASGVVINNTLTNNATDTIRSENAHTWVSVVNNILDNPGNGVHSVDGGVVLNDYNLYTSVWTTAHVEDTEVYLRWRVHENVNIDPGFVNAAAHNYHLQSGAYPVNEANSLTPIPEGGGDRADLGYVEQVATPITLLFGKAGIGSDSPYRLAQWKLDEGSGSTGYDASGNRHNATLAGDPTFVTDVPPALAGFSAYALDLDGVDDYVVVPDDDTFDFGPDEDFSVALWMKPNPVQTDTQFHDNDVVEKWSQHKGSYPFVVRYLNQTAGGNAGKVVAARYDAPNNPSLRSDTRIDDNQYHHVAFVKAGEMLYLYVDGVLENSTTDTTSIDTANNSGLYIGRRGTGTNRFEGALDDIVIYNKALNANEVASLASGAASARAGNSGVASVQVGLSYVADVTNPVTATLPSAWTGAGLTTPGESGSYWNADVTPGPDDGLYRVYTQASDVSGNPAEVQYEGNFIADGTPPVVTLVITGNTSAPAVTLRMGMTDWTPTGTAGETSFNVAQAYFQVDGATVPAEPSLATATQGQAQEYTAPVSLAEGTHTISAHAVDDAGNAGQSDAEQITVSIHTNRAALTDPAPDSVVPSSAVALSGFVHFEDTSGDGQVEVFVDGVSQGMATLADTTAQATSWTKNITLSGDGSHAIVLTASRSAGSSNSHDEHTSLVLDTGTPTITVAAPADGTVFNQDISITGIVSDSVSDVVSLAISDDGGYTWTNEPYGDDGSFEIVLSIPQLQDYVGYPILVRAGDWAGNAVTETVHTIVDSLGPTLYEPISYWPEIGSHTTTNDPYSLSFGAPVDGSGEAHVFLDITTITDTIPTTEVPVDFGGGEYAWPGAGTWYIHMLFEDGIGNQDKRTLGPFYVEEYTGTVTSAVTPFAGSELAAATNGFTQSIIVDGHLDLAHGEWDPDTERLDVDPRFSHAHALYAAWDDYDLFLGWQGALWELYGDAWVYLDTKSGGTEGAIHAAALTLPMQADYAIEINNSTEGHVWGFDGDWQEVTREGFEFAHTAGGDTEIRAPRAALELSGGLGLLAFVYDELTGTVESAFPTTNPIATCEIAGHCPDWHDSYQWAGLGRDVIPNVGQPRGHHARVTLTSPQGFQTGWGPGETLQFVAMVHNLDHVPLTDTDLMLEGGPGLIFEALEREMSITPQADRWVVNVGDLAPDATRVLTLTTRLEQDLTAIDFVTLTAELDLPLTASEPTLSRDAYGHRVDGDSPTVSIDPTSALPPGSQTVHGTASDADGGGVAQVEVRVNGGAWIPAQGTAAWQAVVEVSASDTFELAARATDAHGHVSPVVTQEILVDAEPPTANLALDSDLLNDQEAHLHGTATDTGGSGTAEVQIQIDGGHWITLKLPLQPMDAASVDWRYNWTLPREEGVEHTLAVRAVDGAGNLGAPSAPQTVTVDSIAPVSSIVEPEPGSVVVAPELFVSGVAQDGHGISTVQVSLDGGLTWHEAEVMRDQAAGGVTGDAVTWQYQVPVSELGSGGLVIQSRATDLAGNLEALDVPVRVQIRTDAQQVRMPLILR